MVSALADRGALGNCIRLKGGERLPDALRGGVVAVGNFDGVHRGHRAVLETALDEARTNGIPAIALTFEPHPRTFFRPDHPVFRLTPSPLRCRILADLGFDAVIEQAFDAEFANRSAMSFVTQMLAGDFGVTHVVAGHDFHFGHRRQGTPEFLEREAASEGFVVTLVEPFSDESGEIISSTRIRARLGEGHVEAAADLLGYRHLVEATVEAGKKLGRELGFPTANMALPTEYGLREGVYAVRFRRADGTLYDGVASFGRRPTVTTDGRPILETFLFDFSGDLYGEKCAVSFFAFLRGEEKFDGLDPLVTQMKRDEAAARAALANVERLSPLDRELSF